MSLIKQIALVSQVGQLGLDRLAQFGAALQRQVTRDFAPVWEVQATVDVFGKLGDVPVGYWPIVIKRNIKVDGAAGIHSDKNGQPFALVQFSPGWTLTTSHECLEMLGDPFGNRLMAGDSPQPEQGRVEFLVEVCDPSEDAQFAYKVNGLTVSDFYTPKYFDPVDAPGVRYSFTGAITKPRTVLTGGYLSWHDPVSDHWFQLTRFGTDEFVDLGPLARKNGESLRAMIDRVTTPRQEKFAATRRAPVTAALMTAAVPSSPQGAEERAARLQQQIDGLAE
jgi:hypothetical protein